MSTDDDTQTHISYLYPKRTHLAKEQKQKKEHNDGAVSGIGERMFELTFFRMWEG